MNDTADVHSVAAAQALTVLCVDDEPNILSALRRLLRPEGYRVLTAGSGAEGLKVVAETAVDLVISDMRMPEMDGARFLEAVKARSPDTARILLTGFADLSSTIAAINRAEIYRYISKPWDDTAILAVVRDALERKVLEREKARLERLTARQNLELRELNATLESKVKARTAELASALQQLGEAHDKLKRGFLTSIRVFSNLIELRESSTGGHSRRVADLARRLAQRMKLADDEVQQVMLAGLLHGIGEIGLSDALLRRPFSTLDADERTAVMKHPQRGEAALMAVEQLGGAAKVVRSYRERYDGLGYPDGLRGLAIAQGARVLAVAHDFEAAQDGTLTGTAVSRAQACEHIRAACGSRYDPIVVSALVGLLDDAGVPRVAERALDPTQLEPGMGLTRDLEVDGILLLSKDAVLDAPLIEQLRRYETREGGPLTVYVHNRAGALA